jgi:hypothetical protein
MADVELMFDHCNEMHELHFTHLITTLVNFNRHYRFQRWSSTARQQIEVHLKRKQQHFSSRHRIDTQAQHRDLDATPYTHHTTFVIQEF